MIPGAFYIRDNIYDVSAVKGGNYLGKKPDAGKIAANAAEYGAVSVSAPFPCRCPVDAGPVMKEYGKILKSAGASHRRDSVDSRIVHEIKTGTVTFAGSVTGIPGIIDSEKDIVR